MHVGGGKCGQRGKRPHGDLKAYVYGEFSGSASLKEEWPATKAESSSASPPSGQGPITLEFRYGISFISVEQAKKNLRGEIPAWNLIEIKDAAKARWNEVLGQIAVEGGTESSASFLHGALSCFERMVNITEDGQYYSGFDHQVHQDSRPFYVDNWLWDTYRALEPLQTLLDPDMEADKLQSYVRMYQQAGMDANVRRAVGQL